MVKTLQGCRSVGCRNNRDYFETSKQACESENLNSSWKSECNTIWSWKERLAGEQMGLNWCRNSWQRIGVGRAVLNIGLGGVGKEGLYCGGTLLS